MSRIGRSLATMLVVALSSWSCGSTAPDATSEVATIVVNPSTSTLALNAQLPLQAQVQDGSGAPVPGASVTWTVQDPKIVSVSAAGVVTALAIGTSQVAANALGKSGIATITVTKTPVATVVLLPNKVDVAVGKTAQLSAVALDGSGNALNDRAIIWSSSNQAVATVSVAGLVTAVAPGTATITAASEGKTSTSTVSVAQGAVASVVVTPNPVTMVTGQSAQLAVSPHDASGNVVTGKSAIWASSNTTVATVASDGTVKALTAGTTTITATVDGVSGSTALTVSSIPVGSVSLSPTSATVTTGSSTTLTVTVKDANGAVVTDRVVSWSSSNPSIATVSQSGVVTGVLPGTVTITATSETKSANASVTVSLVPVGGVQVAPSTLSIAATQTGTLTATVTDATGAVVTNRPVVWSSSNLQVATVTQTGVVTGVAVGSATISATSGTTTGTSAVTVTPAPVQSVTVSPATLALTQGGQTGALTATVVDANGQTIANPTVTWTTSDPAIATVNNGVVSPVGPGTATITAASGGKSGSASVTVTQVPPASITIAATLTNIVQNQTTTLTATVKDASGNVLTGRTITWSTNKTDVANLSSTTGQSIDVAGGIAGSATVTASTGGKSASLNIGVVNATVNSVTVTLASSTIKRNTTTIATAQVLDINGVPLQGRSLSWSVSGAATLSNVMGTTSVGPNSAATATVTGKSVSSNQPATITVANGGKSATASLVVTP